MGLGTYFGGWRIVRTMGTRITKLKPVGGFCAESAGAITLFLTILFGIPVSTTHTITGAIVGVGSTSRLSAVRWGIAERIVWAWILTIPASAVVAALTCWVIRLFRLREEEQFANGNWQLAFVFVSSGFQLPITRLPNSSIVWVSRRFGCLVSNFGIFGNYGNFGNLAR